MELFIYYLLYGCWCT